MKLLNRYPSQLRSLLRSGWMPGVLICIGFLSVQAQERELVQVTPSQVGFSEEALQEVSSMLQAEVDAGRIGGAVGMVARHGRIAYFEEFGDCYKDSLFRLMSMTKAVTAAGVMQLVEAGSLKLSDKVSNYIPEFAQAKVYREDGGFTAPEREITIHDLMSHTSGIGYGWFGPEAQDQAYLEAGVGDIAVPIKEKLAERIQRLGPLPLAFDPGTNWHYGLSSDVLGRVIEIVSGLSLDVYFHERIFRPLKMTDTMFYVPDGKRDRLAPFYTPNEDKTKAVRVKDGAVLASGPVHYSADYCYEGNGSIFLGGSGLVGTTTDYMRFLQCLLDNGSLEGVGILEPNSVARMTRNQIGSHAMPFPGHGDAWGYGFGVLTERGAASDIASVGTFSWGGLYNTYFWVDPQEELIGLVMTQIFPYDHLTVRDEFKRLVYQAIDDSGFARRYYYEQGLENGNPHFNGRQLRVNSPNVVVHPRFAVRSEPRSPGLARVLIEEDLRSILGANLYCEIWGGHPGTFNKTVSVNGRVRLDIPEVGSAAENCTHQYPRFNLAPTDLVNGYNALQFNCDRENMGWGHFIVDNARLEIRLPSNHEDLVEAGLSGFSATVEAETDGESINLQLDASHPGAVSKVVYQARYYGYDENGNTWETDWHGMTKEREAYGMAGTADRKPFKLQWDVSMLPAQTGVEVRAWIHFSDHPELVYLGKPTGGLEIGANRKGEVRLVYATGLTRPFWSRDGRLKECTFELDVNPAEIDAAQLHIVTWTGGPGEVEDYFTLNGQFLPVAEGSGHELYYHQVDLEPKLLKRGENTIRLLSDTEHHGIEIMLPGPALMVRTRGN